MIEFPIWAIVVLSVLATPTALLAIAILFDVIACAIDDMRYGR